MKDWFVVVVLILCGFMVAAPEMVRYLPDSQKEEAEATDYWYRPEPVSVLCVSENGDAATYLVAVPEYVGFSADDTAFLEKRYKEGYCDHIRSL